MFRAEERGRFAPKYLQKLSAQAEQALIFVIILSMIEAGIKKVYNKIALVHLSQNSCSPVTKLIEKTGEIGSVGGIEPPTLGL